EVHDRDGRQARDDGPEKEVPVGLRKQEPERPRDPGFLFPSPEKRHPRGHDPQGEVDRPGRPEPRAHGKIAQHGRHDPRLAPRPATPIFARGCDKLPRPFSGARKESKSMTKTTTRLLSTAFAAALFAAPAFAQDPKPTPAPEAAQKSESKMTKTPSGLQYEDTKVGTGASPQKGQ